jgi:hypothetical protein
MKDSKTKTEESTRLTYTGFRHSSCHTYLETSVSESHHLPGWVARTDVPVNMRERGGWGQGGSGGGWGRIKCTIGRGWSWNWNTLECCLLLIDKARANVICLFIMNR